MYHQTIYFVVGVFILSNNDLKINNRPDVDASENRATPKPSILIGFLIINHPFWGTTYFWKHPCKYIYIWSRIYRLYIYISCSPTLGFINCCFPVRFCSVRGVRVPTFPARSPTTAHRLEGWMLFFGEAMLPSLKLA